MSNVRFSSFTHDWAQHTAVVVGNGLSALSVPPEELKRPRVASLVANGGYKTFPEASVLMCTDKRWLAANPDLSGYRGPMIVVTRPEAMVQQDPRMVFVQRRFIGEATGDIFGRRDVLVEGWNSTSTNISCAILRGARRIILIGVDLQPGPDGRRRIYDEVKDRPSAAAQRYARQVRHLTAQSVWVKRKGIEVINCSMPSGLTCYQMGRWEDIKWP